MSFILEVHQSFSKEMRKVGNAFSKNINNRNELLKSLSAEDVISFPSMVSRMVEKYREEEGKTGDIERVNAARVFVHQIRSPITLMETGLSTICLALNKEISTGRQVFTDEILITRLGSLSAALERIKRQIRDVAYAKGFFSIAPIQTTCREIAESLDALQDRAKAENVDLLIEGDDFNINIDKEKVAEVLETLLQNAMEVFQVADIPVPTKTISIKIKGETNGSRKLVASVSNTGPVIPKEVKGKIFNRGFTTKESLGSTGLGLFVVKSIIEAMHGSIVVECFEKTKLCCASTIFIFIVPEANA